jgi:hypothetical protein
MIAAQAADYESTRRLMSLNCDVPGCDYGYRELNPLLADKPDRDSIAILKIGTTGILWLAGEIWPEHREAFYTIGMVAGGAAAGWNYSLYEEHKGD